MVASCPACSLWDSFAEGKSHLLLPENFYSGKKTLSVFAGSNDILVHNIQGVVGSQLLIAAADSSHMVSFATPACNIGECTSEACSEYGLSESRWKMSRVDGMCGLSYASCSPGCIFPWLSLLL